MANVHWLFHIAICHFHMILPVSSHLLDVHILLWNSEMSTNSVVRINKFYSLSSFPLKTNTPGCCLFSDVMLLQIFCGGKMLLEGELARALLVILN